jgi:Holliday junction resolvase
MATEQQLQTKIITWLKSNGFYVIKTSAIPGVPVGCPDVIALKNGYYVALEIKASKTAKKQPLQQHTIDLLAQDGYAFFVWPAVWPTIKAELEDVFAD